MPEEVRQEQRKARTATPGTCLGSTQWRIVVEACRLGHRDEAKKLEEVAAVFDTQADPSNLVMTHFFGIPDEMKPFAKLPKVAAKAVRRIMKVHEAVWDN